MWVRNLVHGNLRAGGMLADGLPPERRGAKCVYLCCVCVYWGGGGASREAVRG